MADLVGIKISFFDEATVTNKNVYGRLLGSVEDTSTSTTIEAATVPAGALVMSVSAYGVSHFFNPISTAASTASNRDIILAGQTKDYEITWDRRGGTKKVSYRTSS